MEDIKIEVTDEQILEWYKKGYDDEKNGTSTIESDDEVLQMAYSEGAFQCGFSMAYPKQADYMYTDDKIIKLVKSEYIAREEGMRAWIEAGKAEAEEYKRVMGIVKQEKGEDWYNELVEYLEMEDCYYSPSIVDKPKGEKQIITDSEGDLLKEEWVNQTTNGGYTGDDFAGTIYFKLSEGRYLEFHYSM